VNLVDLFWRCVLSSADGPNRLVRNFDIGYISFRQSLPMRYRLAGESLLRFSRLALVQSFANA